MARFILKYFELITTAGITDEAVDTKAAIMYADMPIRGIKK